MEQPMTKSDFIRTGVLRGYGTKAQFAKWADTNPKSEYNEDDLLAAHRAASEQDSRNHCLTQNSYCHITPEDATAYGMAYRSNIYWYHPDNIEGGNGK